MASVVDVCNKGLDKLGHGPITSLADGTKSANLCLRNWETIRDQVLRDHPWNFAVKRAILAPSTTAPLWGFSASFPLPADCLRVVEVRDLSTGEYEVEGKAILANETALYIRYIKQTTDPNEFDALFVDAAAVRLAFELCESITQSNTKKNALWEEYQDSLTRAMRVDGQENPPAPFEEDEWIAVRY
jgi:hypothetical protein